MYVIAYNNDGKICHATKFEEYQNVTLVELNSMNPVMIYIEVTETQFNAIKNSVSDDSYYFDSTSGITGRPTRPSVYHEWDWSTKSWILYRAYLELFKLQEATTIFQSSCNAPIDFNGVLFDADSLARSRISNTLVRWYHLGSLPEGFIGWMSYDNTLNWSNEYPQVVAENLGLLAKMIEDREQLYIKKIWALKSQIRNTSSEDLLNMDINNAWDSTTV